MRDKVIDFESRRQEIQQNRILREPVDFSNSMDLLKRGAVDEAIKEFLKLAHQRPEDATVYYNLAFALSEKGLIKESIKAYVQALEIDPHFNNARYNLALELIALGDFHQAEQQLKILLEHSPLDVDAHFEMARLYERRDLYDFALHEYKQVLKCQSDFRLINYCIANIYFKLKNYEAAAAAYNVELSLNPGFSDAHTMLKMVKKAIQNKGKK